MAQSSASTFHNGEKRLLPLLRIKAAANRALVTVVGHAARSAPAMGDGERHLGEQPEHGQQFKASCASGASADHRRSGSRSTWVLDDPGASADLTPSKLVCGASGDQVFEVTSRRTERLRRGLAGIGPGAGPADQPGLGPIQKGDGAANHGLPAQPFGSAPPLACALKTLWERRVQVTAEKPLPAWRATSRHRAPHR